jgi:lysyl-tRNA synthetase class 2
MEPLANLRKIRLEKLEKIKKAGIDPYPSKFERSHTIFEARKLSLGQNIKIAGRIIGQRTHGGAIFFDLSDTSGKIQLFFSREKLRTVNYELLTNFDIGDFLGASGKLFKTQAGELTVEVFSFCLLAKSLRPLPSRWYGLKDIEERLRKRYLDLIFNPKLKEIFAKKSQFWANIRKYLCDQGFLEVETPAVELIPGGADARPFLTHHHAQNIDLYLRISLELHLKRLVISGYEKIFEIGRVFRNEGIDQEHLQDYTQLEFYWAYADYQSLMDFVEDFYKKIIYETFGTLTTNFKDQKIGWGKKWPRIEYFDAFKKYVGQDLKDIETEGDTRKFAEKKGLETKRYQGKGKIIDLIYKKFIRPNLIQPAFLINHPIEVSPLAKKIPGDEKKVQRIQVVACGSELGNGFSELNDPIDQRKRFEEQAKLRSRGDQEAQMMDRDFLEALEYGMPPCAGFGMSERLFAYLVDKPMREVVFFPTLKPK